MVPVALGRSAGFVAGHRLQQQSTAPPDPVLALFPAFADSNAQPCRRLLGLCEIGFRRSRQIGPVQSDHALVLVLVGPVIDGHGEGALAQETAHHLLSRRRVRQHGLHGFAVDLGKAAHAFTGNVFRHDETDRAGPVGLDDQAAIEFQGIPDQGRNDHRFAQQAGDRHRIGVSREDLVQRTAQAAGPTSHGPTLHLVGGNNIVLFTQRITHA